MPINYKLYPSNWKTELVPAVLARTGNKCECCGVPNKSKQWRGKKDIKNEDGRWVSKTFHYATDGDALHDGCTWVYQVKIVLTVAHLDHDEQNWQVKLDRLKAMCQLCHLQYDAKEKYRRLMTKNKNH